MWARPFWCWGTVSRILYYRVCPLNSSCKQVQRALTFWATGTITLQMVLDTKKIKRTKSTNTGISPNGVTLPKVFVNSNGVEESTAFNDTTWAGTTAKYMNFVINGLREKSYNTIVEKAEKLRVSIHGVSTGVDSMDVDHPDDVGLVDLSDSDDECKSRSSFAASIVANHLNNLISIEASLELTAPWQIHACPVLLSASCLIYPCTLTACAFLLLSHHPRSVTPLYFVLDSTPE